MEQSQQGSSQSSISLAVNSKGAVQPDVKLYAPPVDPALVLAMDEVLDQGLQLARHAVTVLCKVADELAVAGAPMVWDAETVSRMRNLYCVRVLKLVIPDRVACDAAGTRQEGNGGHDGSR